MLTGTLTQAKSDEWIEYNSNSLNQPEIQSQGIDSQEEGCFSLKMFTLTDASRSSMAVAQSMANSSP